MIWLVWFLVLASTAERSLAANTMQKYVGDIALYEFFQEYFSKNNEKLVKYWYIIAYNLYNSDFNAAAGRNQVESGFI